MSSFTRNATHAGSWYSGHGPSLSDQLDTWLSRVPDNVHQVGALPQENARVIIAPHAGYAYSGPTAAWAYKSLDLSHAKRIFLLGPSHHYYLDNCALSQFKTYSTPMGDLRLDAVTIAELQATGHFATMSKSVDEEEHSLELHLPYIHKMCSQAFETAGVYPTLIPVLVGNTALETEREYGKIFSKYVEDPTNIFVISSDFCHWGSRFNYTYYLQSGASSEKGINLKSKDNPPNNPKIFESIERLDRETMAHITNGTHDLYLRNLEQTGNTVCGRHPIGIILAALEVLKRDLKVNSNLSAFQFLHYTRSSDVVAPKESSVSYASACCCVELQDLAEDFADDICSTGNMVSSGLRTASTWIPENRMPR